MNEVRVNPSQLITLQRNVEKIRNFCILAHVDHGKTTLSDILISSNGIISNRLAGKLRFLDSTEEEQKRGITMHSSAIALLYQLEEKNAEKEGSGEVEEYLVNLVDSPGHIDFSSDVSTAARLCDGALIIVDVLEGVCTQTHAVIYKALKERIRPCLVLNKIDRLIVESKLTPVEAWQQLRRIIENVNALAFTLVNSECMKEAMEKDPSVKEFVIDDENPLLQEWTFAAEKGNIQFISALDGWGFGLLKYMNQFAKKWGLNRGALRKYLFEDYCLNVETKKIMKADINDPDRHPMFAKLVLEPIWKVYHGILLENNAEPAGLSNSILAIGPKHSPTNMLAFAAQTVIDIFSVVTDPDTSEERRTALASLRYSDLQQRDLFYRLFRRCYTGLVAGFKEAVAQGPLMGETLSGVAVTVDRLEVSSAFADTLLTSEEQASLYHPEARQLTMTAGKTLSSTVQVGQLISEVKEHCRLALLSCPLRVVEPVYQCDLQCDQSQLGNLYAVLSRRRGEVFKEDIIEGTTLFLLSAHLPVLNSFQFAQELLKKTSGNGTAPQLSFSHWRIMEHDPFWKPTTEDELEEFGEQFIEEHNLSRSWINKIRKRKGLAVDEQVVVSAEKQRTLNKKK